MKNDDKKRSAAINRAHRLARSAAESAVDQAIRCGELLTEQKKRLNHGEFTPWVCKHCEFSHDTANVYMRAFRQKTRGLVFSSLSELLSIEHAGTVRHPPRKGFLLEELNVHRPDFDLPEGHDPKDWAYMHSAVKLLISIACHIRDVDPMAIVRGAARGCELRKIELEAIKLHRFAVELRNAAARRRFGHAEQPYDPDTALVKLWDVDSPQEARTPTLAS